MFVPTTAPENATSEPDQGNSGLSSGGKAAVSIFVLAIVIGAGVTVLVIVLMAWRKKNGSSGRGKALGTITKLEFLALHSS